MAMCRNHETALEALYERHVERVLALAYRMVGMRGPAEEIVKAAFGSAWADRATYRPDRGSVRSWLLWITHGKATDVLRGVAPVRVPAAREPPGDELAGRRAARRQGPPRVLDPLTNLPPEQSRVIELAYFGGYDQAEIAAMLEVPVHTVRGRMRAALEHLVCVRSGDDEG